MVRQPRKGECECRSCDTPPLLEESPHATRRYRRRCFFKAHSGATERSDEPLRDTHSISQLSCSGARRQGRPMTPIDGYSLHAPHGKRLVIEVPTSIQII